MNDPAKAPFAAVRLDDVVVVTDIDPDYPDATDGDFHLVRRHFDIRSFGVNGITGGAGDEMVEPHHEADDEENGTNGHEELFAVASGHAVFTVPHGGGPESPPPPESPALDDGLPSPVDPSRPGPVPIAPVESSPTQAITAVAATRKPEPRRA